PLPPPLFPYTTLFRSIPMLVDQQGNPLWLGRRRRTSTYKQFLALMHRDRRCRWPGCNREADRCEGHHRVPWAKGGETNLEDLARSEEHTSELQSPYDL